MPPTLTACASSGSAIVRGTEAVETPAINIVRASGILDNFIPIPRIGVPRGVKQSIAAGTLVARGTSVDLEFLAPNLVQLGLFDGVHADLSVQSEVRALRQEVRDALARIKSDGFIVGQPQLIRIESL